MKDDPISTLMQTRPLTIGMDDTVQAAEAFLNSEGLSWAPVVGNAGEPVGVLSADDLIRFHVANRDAANTAAWLLCTYRPVCVTPDTTISAVAKLMVSRKIHHVVITDDGDLKGVVSSLDLVRTLI